MYRAIVIPVFILIGTNYLSGQVATIDSMEISTQKDSIDIRLVENTITDLFVAATDSTIPDSLKINNLFYSDLSVSEISDSLGVEVIDSSQIQYTTARLVLDYASQNNLSLDSAFNLYRSGLDEGYSSRDFDPESPYPLNTVFFDSCSSVNSFKVRDVFELDLKCQYDRIYMLNTPCVMAVMDVNDMIFQGDSVFFDIRSSLGVRFNLCRDERHYDQPSMAFGTAFMIDSNCVLTAAHCIRDIPLENVRFVVGYEFLLTEDKLKIKISSDRVYSIKRIIKLGKVYDYAYIELNRRIVGRSMPQIKGESKEKVNTTIHCIGYPLGLPMKIIGNGKVVSRASYGYLNVSIDAYKGNSGSPIFDTLTGELIGMLIGGEADLVKTASCNKLRRCLPKTCKDEIVLDIHAILNDIKGN